MQTIYLAGGCFWGMQRFFDQFDGVLETEVGYANGDTVRPTYQEVCQGSGHAETVRIVFDEAKLPLSELLGYYFMAIDPTSLNRQGEDEGIQYRTGIYYEDPAVLPVVTRIYAQKERALGCPLCVEVKPLQRFDAAEEYHQDYLKKHPSGYCHIGERLMQLGKKQSNE